jgi:hypothetical protein
MRVQGSNQTGRWPKRPFELGTRPARILADEAINADEEPARNLGPASLLPRKSRATQMICLSARSLGPSGQKPHDRTNAAGVLRIQYRKCLRSMHAQAADAGTSTTTMKCLTTFPRLPILHVTSSIITIIAHSKIVGGKALSSIGGDLRKDDTDTGLLPPKCIIVNQL